MGILHTIADAIYSTAAGKLREAVANAIDNKATWIVIVVDQTNRTISILDNGCGITKERFREICESIGYSLLHGEPETKLSYFGLGLMSIFQLGKRVKLFTRPKGESQINLLEVDTGDIFDRAPNSKKRSISSLSFTLGDADEMARRKASAPLLNACIRDAYKGDLSGSFTEIIIEEVADEVLDQITEGGFLDEFRKQLPLKPEKDEPFLRRFTGRKVAQVKEILTNAEFCKTIDVYFGIQEQGEIAQLWKYFPRFESDLEFPDDNVYVGTSRDKSFAYYIVHTVAEDLYRKAESEAGDQTAIEKENGFWVRNQNFLVKGADFLQKPGRGHHPLIDQPLRNWIFGEIFHRDMNPFLTVARNDYLYEHPQFIGFREQVYGIVKERNKQLREIWEQRRRIIAGFVEPFIQVSKSDGVLRRAEQQLRKMIAIDQNERKFLEDVFDGLRRARKPEIEKDDARVDVILRKTHKPITLGEDEKSVVRVEPALTGKVDTYTISWDAATGKVVVSVSPDLFNPKEPIVFLGKSFTVCFVALKEGEHGVSVDVDNLKIYINPFNEHLAQYSVSVLDVYLCLEIADAISRSKSELKKNVLCLLGLIRSDAAKYVRPLGDDLRRTLAFGRRRA